MALVTDNACPNFDSDPSVSTLVFIARCRATVRITDYASTEVRFVNPSALLGQVVASRRVNCSREL